MKNAFKAVAALDSLRKAWNDRRSQLVGSCFGIDRLSGKSFGKNLEPNLRLISEGLENGYVPTGLLALAKPKENGGHRIICIPTITDRIVQFGILEQLRPRLKRSGLDNPVSFGLARTKARSVIGARKFACEACDNHTWVYKTDIHKFFDTVDRQILLEAVGQSVPQRTLRPLLTSYLQSEIKDGLEPGWRKIVAEAGIVEGKGVRQGMPLSPFFAGAYLRPLDQWLMKQTAPVARYVDDILAFFNTEREARIFTIK